MLINCPRCGFQQPQDKYCAQCGVDIETFRPVPLPWWKRFAGSLTIQFTLLLVLAIGAGFYVHRQNKENLDLRVSYLKSSVQINSTAKNPSLMDTQPEPGAATAQSAESSSEIAPTEFAPPPPAPQAVAEESHVTRNLTQSPPELVVYYAEVSRNTLNNLISMSRGTGQFMSFNDYSAGILPRITSALNNSQVKVLHKEERKIEAESKSFQWFLGLSDPRDPSRQIGLNTYFELNDIDSRNLRGNMEVLRTWREETTPGVFATQKKTFPAIFEIGADIGFFMFGIMPRQTNLTNPAELLNINIFKILNSPAFRTDDSEFVIFVEFDRSNQ